MPKLLIGSAIMLALAIVILVTPWQPVTISLRWNSETN